MSDTLRTSESIAIFAPAFIALQHALPKVPKNKEGQVGNQKTKYADLETTVDTIKEVLHEHGFGYLQPASGGQGGSVSITTILMHTSGEWMSDVLSMPCGGNGAQGVGSAISYGKRYGLTSILGLATEDDDGHAASQAPRTNARQSVPRPASKQQPAPRGDVHPDAATDAQVRLLAIQCTKAGIEEPNRITFVSNLIGRPIKSTHDLTKAECSEAIDQMTKKAS